MIVAVTEFYHDYKPTSYLLDTSKLNKDDYVEQLVLKECQKKSGSLRLRIDCSNWDSQPDKFKCEPGISRSAVVKKGHVEKSLHITFDFDC